MQSPLLTASTSTFESLALLLPDAPPSASQLAAPLTRGVRVAFDGPLGGTLTLRVSEDVARALAENMLGLDALEDAGAAGDRLLCDALGEVANVICGNVLPELAGRSAVFHLGAPEPVAPGDGDGPADASAAVTLGIDAGHAEVAVRVLTPSPVAS
jgi:CheY-specific phosphatase CheX